MIYKNTNCTLVIMIPNKPDAAQIKDMRPIPRCTVLYKIIPKIVTMRMENVINTVVDDNQFVFILGRAIHDNIFMGQGLIRGYTIRGVSHRDV